MNKQQKIESLKYSMTVKTRADETKYTCFSDTAPESIKDLFLEHYNVKNTDYETFSDACDIMSDIYAEEALSANDDAIYERSTDHASIMTADRLAYLDIWNQEDISEYMKEIGSDIATACAYWYDKQVEQACFIIKDWIDEE